MCRRLSQLERYTFEEYASLVRWAEQPDATSFGGTNVPVQVNILITMIVTCAVARGHHRNLVNLLHAICVADLPRAPATGGGVCGRKEDEPTQELDPIFDFLRRFAIWFGGHRRILPIDVDYPALRLEIPLQTLGELRIFVTVREERSLLSSSKRLVYNLVRLANSGPVGVCSD